MENLLIAAAGHSGRTILMRSLHDLPERSDMENLLDLVSIRDVADRKAGELPEGKRKLVDIAVALALKPRLLLMDEPTSGVASSEKFAIMDILVAALAKQRVTSVFVEHDMDMVTRYADRVAVWSAGKIQMSGPPAEVLRRSRCPRASDRDLKHAQFQQGQRMDRRRARAAQRDVRSARGRDGGADRPQRRRQDHHRPHHHGIHRYLTASQAGRAISARSRRTRGRGWGSAMRRKTGDCSRRSPSRKTSCCRPASQSSIARKPNAGSIAPTLFCRSLRISRRVRPALCRAGRARWPRSAAR